MKNGDKKNTPQNLINIKDFTVNNKLSIKRLEKWTFHFRN